MSDGVRTRDPWNHNPMLYPTELHSPQKFIGPKRPYSIPTAFFVNIALDILCSSLRGAPIYRGDVAISLNNQSLIKCRCRRTCPACPELVEGSLPALSEIEGSKELIVNSLPPDPRPLISLVTRPCALIFLCSGVLTRLRRIYPRQLVYEYPLTN